MLKYHKIQTVFKRDPKTKFKTLLYGEFPTPEFGFLADNTWVFTEKVDGTNIRIHWDGWSVSFGGRTDNAQIPPFLLDHLETKFTKELMESVFGSHVPLSVTLFGEGYGPKIQKGGGNYRKDVSFCLFDVFLNNFWLEAHNVMDIAVKMDNEFAPVIGHGTLYDLVERAQKGIKSQWGDFQAEGIVARPLVELLDRHGNRIITKIKCNDFKGS